ncbi:DUF1501 domain-containing protein [Parvibium lacunae]|uniref:DUF1501 domain-containing protein n=1 Tax=Parvibium lacunae TaxID=1888893 RepID=A0A368KZN3_9BURK|nr:DUF1501 domain-containing protein [Parvibium lacunae]RCS56763.1 DUF1501 domain-containing protein [Parvibium lacunae]
MTHATSRRAFLKHAALCAAAGPAAAPFALNLATLAAMSSVSGAAQAQSVAGYKALVCVFLFGGNDSYNTVVPYDTTSYNAYSVARSTAPDPIALSQGTLLPLIPNTTQASGRLAALHPNLGGLKTLFDATRLAVVSNVGPLIRPTTKTQYNARSVTLPPRLFSHNDQQNTWQAFAPEGASYGWGGRMGDLLMSSNTNTIFTCISAAGNAVWLSGQSALQYQVSNSGAIQIAGLGSTPLFGSSVASAQLRSIITNTGGTNLLEREHGRIVGRSVNAETSLTAAIGSSSTFTTALPASNSLANQLQVVARIINARAALGTSRQVFFVSLGGFDTHDLQNTSHATLMTRLNAALVYFDSLLGEMAATDSQIRQKVTLFTASDFGRTLTSNGDGTDHGWGAHHFVMGGAVRGKDIYGTLPEVGTNTPDEVGQGRLLPSLAVDQYGATLAKWFGLSAGQISTVFPNIGNFAVSDLNFLT